MRPCDLLLDWLSADPSLPLGIQSVRNRKSWPQGGDCGSVHNGAAVCTIEQTPLMAVRNMRDHAQNHERTSAVTVHGMLERPVNVGQTTSAAAAGRSVRRLVSLEHTLHDQVRNLRMAPSDLKIQVSDIAAAFGRE
jgi:hypothetical protein